MPTILRELPSRRDGRGVTWSVRPEWPDAIRGIDPMRFPEADVWRGAAFHAVVGRVGPGPPRWLAVRTQAGLHLRLIDHIDAFPLGAHAPRSPFYDLKRGGALPADVDAALRRLVDALPGLTLFSARGLSLPTLLPVEAIEALQVRVRVLCRHGRLELG